jgi:hypothetical protein
MLQNITVIGNIMKEILLFNFQLLNRLAITLLTLGLIFRPVIDCPNQGLS